MSATLRLLLVSVTSLILVVTTGIGPAAAAYSTSPRDGMWPVLNGRVYAIAVHGDRVYIAGTFTRVRNPATGQRHDRLRLAAFDRSTGDLVTGWTPTANDAVRALAVSSDGSTVFAGGAFTSVNGTARERLAAIDRNGNVVAGWRADANREVRDLQVLGDALFAGGRFTFVAGQRRLRLAKLHASTGSLTGWRANATLGGVFALDLSDDGALLIAGGNFNALAGETRDHLGAVNTSTGAVHPWQPRMICSRCHTLDVVSHGDHVYSVVNGPGGRASGWRIGSGDPLWTRSGDGDTQAVGYHEGVVYVGGHFGPRFSGAERHQLAALRAGDGQLLSYQVAFTGSDKPGVWSIAADSDHLRVGGGFRGIEGSTAVRYAEFAYE